MQNFRMPPAVGGFAPNSQPPAAGGFAPDPHGPPAAGAPPPDPLKQPPPPITNFWLRVWKGRCDRKTWSH